MNILSISKYASIPKYGTGARLFFLTKEFAKLGHNAMLITSDSNHLANFPKTDKRYNFEEIDGLPLCWIETKKYTKTASVQRILSWIDFDKKLFSFPKDKLNDPDIILVSSLSITTIIYGYYLKKKYNAKLIFEIRDIWPLTMTEEANFSKWHPLVLLLGWIEKFGYKNADLVVGTMPKLDQHVEDILGYQRPFFCSPLGFNEEDYLSESYDDDIDLNIDFPKNKTIIGYAGSLGITNSLEPFMESIKLLSDNSHIHFMIVGGGDLKDSFENDLKEYNNVTFLPRIQQSMIKYFLDRCDILYLSTQHSKVWEYGQSMNKVVEYMLAAKPIVASYSGYPSMINEAQCGKFIETKSPEDIKNAILSFANMSSEELQTSGQNGRDWIYSHRTYKTLAKEYIDMMQEIKNG